MARLSRRGFLGTVAAAGAAAGLDALPLSVRSAMAAPAAAGSLSDVQHVVIFMQENRSFDHYLGALSGVRGFADRSVVRFPKNSTVWAQTTSGPSGGSVLYPWHLDTTTTDAQRVADLDHSWSGTHSAWSSGRYNNWIPAKSKLTMGYYTRSDIPFQYTLADAFTVCDGYFCSVLGPTNPNRLYLWTGMIDPTGTGGGPVTTNSEPGFTWTTYPERLEAAGISWRVYQQTDNYDDNALAWFNQYRNASTTSSLYVNGMTNRSADAFAQDVANGTLPSVSWIIAPTAQSEHPAYPPAYGADYTAKYVLDALAQHPDVWAKTVVLLNYDENDGFFDHVAPPTPPSGTAAEFVSGAPIGLGPRVPMFVISPWSRGGRVASEVFDHTSVIRFLENWTGVKEPNISAWRRTVCGDLMSAFDFSSSTTTFPSLPDTTALVAAADQENSLPAPSAPKSSSLPGQESGSRTNLAAGYRFAVTSWTDTATGRIWMQVVNNGTLGAGFTAYTVNFRSFATWQYTAASGATVKDYFSAKTYGGGPYDVDWHGPDGFLRGFQGNVLTWSDSSKAHPEAYVVDVPASLSLALTVTNASGAGATATFTVSGNGYGGGSTQTVKVAPGGSANLTLASANGLYDYTVTADTGDGFARRFAGRIQP